MNKLLLFKALFAEIIEIPYYIDNSNLNPQKLDCLFTRHEIRIILKGTNEYVNFKIKNNSVVPSVADHTSKNLLIWVMANYIELLTKSME